MIYVMECNSCDSRFDVECPLSDYNSVVKPGVSCICGGKYRHIIVPGGLRFAKEGFPKGDPGWEHVSDDPIFIRDKIHLKDICQQNGNISRFLEDDC